MKNIFTFFILIFICVFLFGCAVNSSTASIVFQNNSDADVTLKVGDASLWAAKGSANTIYLYQEKFNQKISVEGLSIGKIYYGIVEVESVNIIFNYRFNFVLNLDNTNYSLNPDPVYVGDQRDSDVSKCLNFR